MKKKTALSTSLNAKKKSEINEFGEILSARIKFCLERDGKKSYIELAKAIGITSSSLYRAIKRGTVTFIMLEGIAKYLEVHPLYFLENEIIDRMADEIMKRAEILDLKSFMFGFSRDIAKGMKLEDAVLKNMSPETYRLGLMI